MPEYQPPVKSPKATLCQLKRNLKDKQQTAENTGREIAELNESIAALERITKEIEEVLINYGQTFRNLKCDEDDLRQYLLGRGEKIINETTKDVRDKIDGIRNEFDRSTRQMETESLRKYNEAQENYLTAKKIRDEKLTSYDNLKNYQKRIEEILRDIKDLRTESEAKYNAKSIRQAYFFVDAMKEKLENFSIDTTDKFKQELKDKSHELYEAEEDFRNKSKAWETAKQEFTEEQKNIEERKTNRSEEILERISKL